MSGFSVPTDQSPALIKALQDYADHARDYFQRCRRKAPDREFGVSGNTWRGLGGVLEPSRTYRRWARTKVEAIVTTPPRSLEQLEELLLAAREELGRAFQVNGQKQPTYGQIAKLVALFFKFIASHRDLDQSAFELIVEHGPVPLDKHVLASLRAHGVTKIPAGATMGWVDSPEKYDAIQAYVRRHTIEAGVPNLYFDWVWNQQDIDRGGRHAASLRYG